MTPEERRRLLELTQDATTAWWDSSSVDDLSIEADESARRRAWLEAARHYDPASTLSEELTVRLVGEQAEGGALRFSLGDALLRPLQESVSAVAGADVELEITGLSHGSTILHVRPVGSTDELLAPGGPHLDSSAADQAVRSLLLFVRAIEAQEDIRQWDVGLDSMDRLVQALDRFSVSMGLTWFAFDGETRGAELTDAGKSYFRQLMQPVETLPSERALSGRVTELRLSGVVKVKLGTSRQAPAYDVRFEPGQLLDLHLELGQSVGFLVREQPELDGTGRVRDTTYNFVRVLSSEESLDLLMDDDDPA